MPTPKPIMASISGAKVGHVQDVADQVLDGEADGDAEQRGEDGQAHGHHRSEGDEHDDHGGENAEALARSQARRRPRWRSPAAQRHVLAGGGKGLGRVDDPVTVALAMVA